MDRPRQFLNLPGELLDPGARFQYLDRERIFVGFGNLFDEELGQGSQFIGPALKLFLDLIVSTPFGLGFGLGANIPSSPSLRQQRGRPRKKKSQSEPETESLFHVPPESWTALVV